MRRAIVIVLGLVAVFAAALSTAPVGARGSQASATDPCPGLEVLAEVDGTTLCTHGPDAPFTPQTAPPEGVAPEATSGIQCYGNGTSGARVQLIYAHPAGVDRFASLRPQMLVRAAQIDAIYNASAAQTGGRRHVRWVTDSACNLDVRNVTVSSAAIPYNGMSTLADELDRQGFDSNDRKYLVWVETNNNEQFPGCAGLASVFPDDRPGQENLNNQLVGYTRIDETCLRSFYTGEVEAHELMHNLGAVQSTAPRKSPNGHCSDEHDVMCYDGDGPGPFRTSIVCTDPVNESRLDCNHDDYFRAPNPISGYLATHWNTANSRWLSEVTGDPPVPTAPGAPTNVGATAGNGRAKSCSSSTDWHPPKRPGPASTVNHRAT